MMAPSYLEVGASGKPGAVQPAAHRDRRTCDRPTVEIRWVKDQKKRIFSNRDLSNVGNFLD
jgi:hypothetical protein